MCEPAATTVVKGILMEFIGMDWSPAHNLTAEVSAFSWVAEDLLCGELDEERSVGPIQVHII